MIIQFCGLSGAGKTTLAQLTEKELKRKGQPVEIIDGDHYRETLCKGLGFSKNDRKENLRRLAFIAAQLSKHGIISIICAINPYEEIRKEIKSLYKDVKTIHIDCPLATLLKRDTKGLYKRAYLEDGHPEKINNLTGVNDIFEIPGNPDLYLNTATESIQACVGQIIQLIEKNYIIQSRYQLTKDIPLKLVKVG